MNLIKYDNSINRIINDINRFDDLFLSKMFKDSSEKISQPSMDIYEKDNNIIIEAELPGIKKENISLKLENGFLSISGENKNEKKKENKNTYYCERTYGKFERTIAVPNNLKAEDINAEYENGVLKLSFSKSIENKNIKKIDIN